MLFVVRVPVAGCCIDCWLLCDVCCLLCGVCVVCGWLLSFAACWCLLCVVWCVVSGVSYLMFVACRLLSVFVVSFIVRC